MEAFRVLEVRDVQPGRTLAFSLKTAFQKGSCEDGHPLPACAGKAQISTT